MRQRWGGGQRWSAAWAVGVGRAGELARGWWTYLFVCGRSCWSSSGKLRCSEVHPRLRPFLYIWLIQSDSHTVIHLYTLTVCLFVWTPIAYSYYSSLLAEHWSSSPVHCQRTASAPHNALSTPTHPTLRTRTTSMASEHRLWAQAMSTSYEQTLRLTEPLTDCGTALLSSVHCNTTARVVTAVHCPPLCTTYPPLCTSRHLIGRVGARAQLRANWQLAGQWSCPADCPVCLVCLVCLA